MIPHAPGTYLAHGLCLLWEPALLWLTVIGHALTALSYLGIPILLLLVVRRRRDLPMPMLWVLFSLFIASCAVTHLLAILTIWRPVYWLSAWVGLITGILSVLTWLLLHRVIPVVDTLPSGSELSGLRGRIEQQQQSLDTSHAQRQLTKELLQEIDDLIARMERLTPS